MSDLQMLEMLKADCRTDTQNLEGQVLSGPLMAEQFALVRAQIAALASVMIDLIDLSGDTDDDS